MLVQIESRRDYELHIKKLISNIQVSNKQKAVFRKIAMRCFDDGIVYHANNGGVVEIHE